MVFLFKCLGSYLLKRFVLGYCTFLSRCFSMVFLFFSDVLLVINGLKWISFYLSFVQAS